jgi:ActR/RegA family two-component response regulator
MNRHSILSLSALAAFWLVVLPGSAVAQQKSLKEQIIGTWVIVLVPFNSTALAMTAMIAGHVHYMAGPTAEAIPDVMVVLRPQG